MKKMLKTISKTIIPSGARKKLRTFFYEEIRKDREEREKQIPKVPLTEKHVMNCELLLNRASLLSKLKKGGEVAEIGVDRGEFSELILEITEPVLLHLIDIWSNDRYHGGLFERVTDKFGKLIENGRVQIHRKLSTDAAEDFQDNYFDWIYIDTDHSYEITRDELLKYALKVKNDGIIAGHDYSMGEWVNSYRYGVIEAVHEFCVENGWEIVYLTLEPTEMQSFALRRIQLGSGDDF
jgi:hypothetical protein